MSIQEQDQPPNLVEVERSSLGDAQVVAPVASKPSNPRPFWFGIGLTAIIGVVATVAAPLPGLSVMGSLTVALLLGIIWRAIAGLPPSYTGGVQYSAKKLLRYAIILTGVRLNFGLIASSGLEVLLLDVLLITFGVTFIPWLARRFGLPKGLALLMGVGQSICGASAVGAAASLTPDATDDDISLAVAICGLLGTVGVVFYAFATNIFHWQGRFYGMLSGSTLHEIAQVAAAGPAGGPGAADLALVVKLTRVMLLAPVAIILAFLFTLKAEKQSNGGQHRSFDWKKVPVPWFVFGFLLVGVLNSTGVFSKDVANIILQAATFLFVMSMAGMGLMVDLVVIRKTGLKTVGVATLAFAIFISLSYGLITVLGLA